MCGKFTVAGGRCQNPPGCALPHRPADPGTTAATIAPADLSRVSVPGRDPIGTAGPGAGPGAGRPAAADTVVRVAEILGSIVAARDEHGEDPEVPDLETDLSDLVAGLARNRGLPSDLQDRADRFADRYDQHLAEFDTWVEAGGRGVDDSERLDRQRVAVTVEGVAIAEAFFYEHATAGDLARIASHPHPDARRLAAQHPRCPPAARAHAGLLAG